MTLVQLQSHRMLPLNLRAVDAQLLDPAASILSEPGLSRRQFVLAAGGAAIVGAGSSGRAEGSTASSQGRDRASCPAPRPIPGGFVFAGELFHVFPPALGFEPSSIFDFQGSVGVADSNEPLS